MKKPFYLDFLEVVDRRYNLPNESQNRLWAMQVGYQGQVDFDQILQKHLPTGWQILHDLSFDREFGKIQIDTLVVSPHTIYHFEVKNLVSECEYRDNEWYNARSGQQYRNYFTQVNRQNEILSLILSDLSIKMALVSKLVLINEEDTVTFYQDMQEHYLKRWQIAQFIRKESKNFSKLPNQQPVKPEVIANILVEHSVEEFVKDTHPEQEFVKDVRGGILCPQCHAPYRMKNTTNKVKFQCDNCGCSEPKERAIVRTICEIGLLNYEKDLDINSIYDFIGEPYLSRSIKRVLGKYFRSPSPQQRSYYYNPKKPFERAFSNVKFYFD